MEKNAHDARIILETMNSRGIDIVTAVPENSEMMREFIEFPSRLYADSPCYVSWFDRGMKRILKKEHPFFEHSEGDFFLIRREGKTVGRTALLEPKKFNSYRNRKDARFYFIDFIDDESVVQAIAAFAEQWARSRGLNCLVGPQGFSAFTGAGILVKGFDEPASMTMMNYHYPYYAEHLEAAGFSKYKDFFSADLQASAFTMPDQTRRIAEIARKRSGLEIRNLRNRRDMKRTAYRILDIYNTAWETHEEFCPLTEKELDQIVSDVTAVTDPSLIKIFCRGEELAGFLLTFPDLTRALQRARGRLNLFTLLDIMLEKKRTRKYLVNGIGILPKYQNSAGQAMLFAEIEKTLRSRGVDSAEMTQIAETTDAMMKSIEKLHGRIYKIHRIYMKELDA